METLQWNLRFLWFLALLGAMEEAMEDAIRKKPWKIEWMRGSSGVVPSYVKRLGNEAVPAYVFCIVFSIPNLSSSLYRLGMRFSYICLCTRYSSFHIICLFIVMVIWVILTPFCAICSRALCKFTSLKVKTVFPHSLFPYALMLGHVCV